MNYRNLFIGVDDSIKLENGNHVVPINFDNGATTPPMIKAQEEIEINLKNYSSIGRGSGQKSIYCTDKFEDCRADILRFFNLEPTGLHTVIYVKSTTEGFNLLAHVLTHNKNQVILTTRMEHHANDLPWRYNCKKVEYIDVDRNGRINHKDIEEKLLQNKGEIKYVTITAASNVTGYVNDINKIATICHKYGAKIIVDAAQLVAHREIDMLGKTPEEQIDFLVFSAHKAYAPYGAGAIIGLKDILNNVDSFLKGGGPVDQVFDYTDTLKEVPNRLEGGTQNFLGVISMVAALNELKRIGFKNIVDHENEMKNYLIENMLKMNHVVLYGDIVNIEDRIGIIIFNIKNINFEDFSERLANDMGIATRSGKFCAQPYATRLLGVENTPENREEQDECGMVRISLGLYNTMEEVEKFLSYLRDFK